MATKKASPTLAKDVTFNSSLLTKVLIGLLFICIGVQGCMGSTSNGLYRAIGEDAINIVLGIILILAGVLMIVPSFLKGINAKYVKVSMIVISVVWVLVIIFSDFVYGLKGVNGDEWFYWLETLIYHIMVLIPILKTAVPAVVKK